MAQLSHTANTLGFHPVEHHQSVISGTQVDQWIMARSRAGWTIRMPWVGVRGDEVHQHRRDLDCLTLTREL